MNLSLDCESWKKHGARKCCGLGKGLCERLLIRLLPGRFGTIRRKPLLLLSSMSFQLEIAVFTRVKSEPIDWYVPFVFGYSGTSVDFEHATSVSMGSKLAAVQFRDFVIVLDTCCRWTGIPNLFDATDTQSDSAVIIRIADQPIAQVFEDRVKMCESVGSADVCSSAQVGASITDGEDAAVAALAKHTGIRFPADLIDLTYRIYELD